MKYGVHFRSWDGLYAPERLADVIRQAAEIGADSFEVFPPPCVLDADKRAIRELRKSLEETNIELLLTFRYPENMDLASEDADQRKNGIEYMKRAIQGAAELGARAIGGIVYSIWPYPFTGGRMDKTIKYERTQRSIESMRSIMPTAQACNVYLNAEILNRFEHYMLNTAQEGVNFCKQVESSHLGLLLDVFHMNIEEDSFSQAIHTAAPFLGHFHVSEPNRGIPREQSRINWREIGEALRQVGYQGTVTMEPILLFLGDASYNSRLWRDLIDDPAPQERLRLLRSGLDVIRTAFTAP